MFIFVFLCTAELGDFNEEEHKEDYLAEFCFVPNQSDELLQEVASMHKKHRSDRVLKYSIDICKCLSLTLGNH